MKPIQFKENATQRIYDNYLKRLKKVTKELNPQDREDVLMEMNSHIYESTQASNQTSEVESLLDALQKLGEPEEVLKPLVADKKMDQALRTFNPIHLVKALALNLTNGVSYVLFALLYLLLFSGLFVIIAKIVDPENVGLFFEGDNFRALGRINSNSIQRLEVTEALGYWFIPVMILAMVVFYFLITLLLKFKRSINKK